MSSTEYKKAPLIPLWIFSTTTNFHSKTQIHHEKRIHIKQ
jgi:hypothetical protein